MSKFKYELTQILTLVYQAKKEQLLTDDERKIIKEYIISTEPDLTVAMEKYEENKNLNEFVESLKISAGITSITSPIDTFLIGVKKRKNRKKEEEKVEKVEQDNNLGLAINSCELGNSPVIMPKTFKKTKK